MLRIRFSSEEDEINGFYILATQASLRGLREGTYEVAEACLAFLDHHAIKYVVIPPSAAVLDEAAALRNSPTVEL